MPADGADVGHHVNDVGSPLPRRDRAIGEQRPDETDHPFPDKLARSPDESAVRDVDVADGKKRSPSRR
jgi:hypothetical protein